MAIKKLSSFTLLSEVDANNDLVPISKYISPGVYETRNIPSGAVGFSGNYNDLSGLPTLGTSAALDVGTSADNVVQLDGSARLPSVDGSQLTNLPVSGVPYQTFKATQTSNYTIIQDDHGSWIPCDTNDLTITLPDGLATGTQVIIDRQGTATVTVTASTTLIGKNVSANSVQIANQYGVVHCVHQGSNIWRITGDL